MLGPITKFIKVLNSEVESYQIALAFSIALLAGLTPKFSVHLILVFTLAFILRTNLSAFFVGCVLFSLFGILIDPLLHAIGLWVLTQPSLEPLFTNIYNLVFWKLTNFNNSIVMGAFVFWLLMVIPSFFFFRWLIDRYRRHVMNRVKKTKLYHVLMASRLGQAYTVVSQIKG